MSPERHRRRLLVFTKPARPGRVKTRLIGDLTAEQAAELHAAFLGDLLTRLTGGSFELRLAWALEPGEALPEGFWPGVASMRQEGAGLGDRLFGALAEAARGGLPVAALGSDHPTVGLDLVERAFAAVEGGADVALGPAEDGGYYLIAVAAGALRRRLFEEVPWSTGGVLAATLARCRELGLAVELLPPAADVDTPADLARLAAHLDGACPRTRALLAAWNRLPGPRLAPPAPGPPAPAAPGAASGAPSRQPRARKRGAR